MSVPTYDSYRDSGVDGLGRVPSHWSVAPAKYAMTARSGGASIKGECADSPDDGLYQGYSASGPNVWLPDFEYDGPGLVLSAVGARCGKVFKADGKWGVVANTHCLIPREGSCRDFLWYLTNDESWWEKGGTAQPFVKVPDSLVRKIALPTVGEQVAIARFLDRETAKIDTLVAEQERLIALLKEKRQAVISHAVTKGLNPNAPMKDSGIEWLGEIPAHWNVSRLKFSTNFITSGSRGWGDYYADEGPLFIRITNLTRDSIHLDMSDEQRVAIPQDAEGSRTRLQPGDLLFSITAYLGSVAVVPDPIEEAYISQHVALCRLSDNAPASAWLGYTAMSTIGNAHFNLRGYGGTKVQLSLNDVGELPILIPPTSEQEAILIDLERRLASFCELEADARCAITLLQERRAALISAAVTGKIDVRGRVAVDNEMEAA